MIITLSGLPGSGTSTVAGILSNCTGFEVVSAGDIFRMMAEESGLTLEEFGELASSDPDIDQRIDRHQKEIASDAMVAGRDVIIEGRLSAWMAEPDLAVLITAPLDVRAERVVRREGILVSDATRQIREREACEAGRYSAYYGIDVNDQGVYDLVINSRKWDQRGVAEIILKAIEVT